MQDKTLPLLLICWNLVMPFVMNDTVFSCPPLWPKREETGGHVELLLLKNTNGDEWEVLAKCQTPSRLVHVSALVMVASALSLRKNWPTGPHCPLWIPKGIFLEVLESLGEMPLPPYIHENWMDRERYQTVLRQGKWLCCCTNCWTTLHQRTAGRNPAKGVHLVYLTLHVGLGTFRPVSVDNLDEHEMHSEFYQLSGGSSLPLRSVKENGGRVIAVGTTSIRTLETIGSKFWWANPSRFWLDQYLYQAWLRMEDCRCIFNQLHLPKSTLVMLVSAFAGRELVLDAYHHTHPRTLYFFSFGDAMFIYEFI